MNGFEISQCLEQHPLTSHSFKGVYSRDELKNKHLQPGNLFIINTDKRQDPGAHWVLFYRGRSDPPLYFDSYGNPPLHKEMYEFAIKDNETFGYNAWRLQDVDSSVCGHYVTYLAARLCAGESIENIRRAHFSEDNTKLNDRMILTLFRKEFGFSRVDYKMNYIPQTCHCLCHNVSE